MEADNASTYDDFEPYCKWERHEAEDVLIVHLPDFKRNDLIIQINKFGVLTVSGECQPAKGVSKASRFTKKIRISSEYYDEEQIHAKFVSGILYITMPHRVPLSKTKNDKINQTENLKNKTKGNTSDIDGITDVPPLKDIVKARKPSTKQLGCVKKNAVDTFDAMCKEMSYGFGSITGLNLDGEKGHTAALVASAVAVSGFGAYVVYKLWSGSKKT